MNFITLLQYLPIIVPTIKQVELAFPLSGQGAAKLEAVLSILELADGGVLLNFRQNLPKLIGIIVTLLNKTGSFKT
jgi:hypothetical protein